MIIFLLTERLLRSCSHFTLQGTHELDRLPVSWLSLNVCTTRTDGHESKAFWCGRHVRKESDAPLPAYNTWSRQVGATGQQLSQDLRHCRAVGRTQGAASLLPEL